MDDDDNVYCNCDWCGKPIFFGNASVTVNRNIEQVDQTDDDHEGVVTVIQSDPLLTLCAECGNHLYCDSLGKALRQAPWAGQSSPAAAVM